MEILDEIAYPDPLDAKRLKRLQAILVVAVAALCCAARLWIQAQFSAAGHSLDPIRKLLAVLPFAIAAPPLVFGAWFCLLGHRVLRTQQWPYPGAMLTRPVPVVRGRQASGRAIVFFVIGSSIAIAGVAAGTYLHLGVSGRLEDLLNTGRSHAAPSQRYVP